MSMSSSTMADMAMSSTAMAGMPMSSGMSMSSGMPMSSGTMAGMGMTSTAMSGMPMSTGMSDMGGMSGMGGSMSMAMPFTTDNTAVSILSTAFTTTTIGQYVGAWFMCFFLAVIWRALVLLHNKMDEHWVKKYSARAIKMNEGEQIVPSADSVRAWRLSTNLPRAALSSVIQGLAYILMLIVMIMNVGLFFAVLVGYFIGELFFGRVGTHSVNNGNC